MRKDAGEGVAEWDQRIRPDSIWKKLTGRNSRATVMDLHVSRAEGSR